MKKVEDFYPITTITFPDGEKIEVILDVHLEECTPPIKLNSLRNALSGCTRVLEGVYPVDVESWLNNQQIND